MLQQFLHLSMHIFACREPEESFLLMGTPPRGVAQSRVIPVVKNQTPVNTKPETTDAAPVDLLFSNTPETRKVRKNLVTKRTSDCNY